MKISGSVAIVTGGGRGLGRSYTAALLDGGAKVCFADNNTTTGRESEAEFIAKYGADSVLFVECDVTDEESFKALFAAATAKFGQVTILVNNAGILDENLWRRAVDVNLKGVIEGTNLAVEAMRRDRGGAGGLIVNIASVAGLVPVSFMPVYAATKWGVLGFTKSWATNPSLGSMGLNFAAVCPGFTDTLMVTDAIASDNPPLLFGNTYRKEFTELVKQLGINTIEDVAKAFVELVEKEDNNGSVVTIDTVNGTVYV